MNEQPAVTDERMGGTSASNAPGDALCAGRHLAQAGLPDVRTSDATFGEEIHEALRTDDDSKLTPDQQGIAEACREIRDKLVAQYFGDQVKDIKVFKEQRYWVKVRGKWQHSGKPDYIARVGPKALIVEYKCLPGDVATSPTNEQLRDQVVLAAGNLIMSEVAAAVVQPLVTYSPELTVYDAAAIKLSEKRMFDRVEASNNAASKRTPGEVQCKFCKAKPSCVEYQAWAQSTLPATQPIAGTPVANWTPQQRQLFCDLRGVAQKWLDDCTEAMKAVLKAEPDGIPGWTLEEGDTREKVTDPNGLHGRFLGEGGTTEQFLSCISVTKKELTSQLRDITKLKGKALDAKLKALLDGLTESKQNAPSLARRKE